MKALIAATAVLSLAQPVLAGHVALEPGRYEVAVNLELPHVEDAGAVKTATICIAPDAPGGTLGLVVLSENNPLAKCPASDVRQDGDTITFKIACPGGNAAIASATYTLIQDHFKGRITMKMGGKNMTMTETQTGKRVGECAGAGAPHS